MVLGSLKNSTYKQKTDDSPRSERETKTAGPDEPADPRPLPVTHDRHLDVNQILERSLPRLSGDG